MTKLRVVWIGFVLAIAHPCYAHIMQKSYVETTRAGLPKLYIRIKESPKHPGYYNFQLCQFKYKDKDQFELDLDRACNDTTQGEMAISAFPNRIGPGRNLEYDQNAYEHYFKIDSMVPYERQKKRSGALGVDDRRSRMEDFATLVAAFSVGEFAVAKLGVKSLILALGIDIAAYLLVDEMKQYWAVNDYLAQHAAANPAYRAAASEPKNRKWDGFFGTKYWPTIELTTVPVMTGKNEQGYATPFLLGACTKEDLEEKFSSSRFSGNCTTIQEAALILEIALQEFAYHQQQMILMNSRAGLTTSTPLDVFNPDIQPWREDFADPGKSDFDRSRDKQSYVLDARGNPVLYKTPEGGTTGMVSFLTEHYYSYVQPPMKTPADDITRWGDDLSKWWKGLWED